MADACGMQRVKHLAHLLDQQLADGYLEALQSASSESARKKASVGYKVLQHSSTGINLPCSLQSTISRVGQ